MFGRDLRLLLDLQLGRPEEEAALLATDYAVRLQESVLSECITLLVTISE